MPPSPGGEQPAERRHDGEPGTDGADEIAASGARPFGRQEPLRPGRERCSEVGDVSADRYDADRDRRGHPDQCRGAPHPHASPGHHADQCDGQDGGDDQGPLDGVEDPARGRAEHAERDRQQPETDADQADHVVVRHRSTNSDAEAAANPIPGPPTAPSPMRTTVIRSTAPNRLDGPDGPVTINTDV